MKSCSAGCIPTKEVSCVIRRIRSTNSNNPSDAWMKLNPPTRRQGGWVDLDEKNTCCCKCFFLGRMMGLEPTAFRATT